MAWRPEYGPNSPFTGNERDTIDAVIDALQRSTQPAAASVLGVIQAHFERLEAFGDLLARFPSPLTRRSLGSRQQNVVSLARGLCQSSIVDFEFRAPTRAIVGRALDMAESNFYRLLRHACGEVLLDGESLSLREQAAARLRDVIYTKLTEEVLSDIVSDSDVDKSVRLKSGYALAHIWDRRLTYRTKEFFPLLEATWEARRRIRVVGGTLLGTEEMFALFREGCDPQFVDYFVRPNPTEDEVEAFREFLFGRTAEELQSLADRMDRERVASFPLLASAPPIDDPGTLVYEFFRTRYLQAVARRMAGLPGPKRTAEGYVMIAFLEHLKADELVAGCEEPLGS
jgi:hypothetical protein